MVPLTLLRYCLAASDRLSASPCPKGVAFATVGLTAGAEPTAPTTAGVVPEEEQAVTAVIARIAATVNSGRARRKR